MKNVSRSGNLRADVEIEGGRERKGCGPPPENA